MSTQRFHGAWTLAEWTVTVTSSGEVRRPFGGEVDGHIIYSPAGWMSATLMARQRPVLSDDRMALNELRRQLAAGDRNLDAQQLDLLADYFLAAHGYITYCGPFDVDEREVHHHVHASLLPHWVGTTLDRVFAFSDDDSELVLSAEQPGYNDLLRWQRKS